MTEENVILCAYWRERPSTAREFIRICYEFLGRLHGFSSAFERRCVAVGELPAVAPVIVPDDYEGFEQVLVKAIPNRRHAYTNPDKTNKKFTLDSTITAGFRISFSDPGENDSSGGSLAVSVTGGAHGGPYTPTNVVLIEIPRRYRAFWEDTPMARQLVEIVIASWQPSFAALTSTELRQLLDPNRRNDFTLGPISYFAEKDLPVQKREFVSVENMRDGGSLIFIDAEFPWALSADRFKPSYSAMDTGGFLQWPHRRVQK